MSESLYASCAQVLSVSQSNDDLKTLLDPRAGFAPRLRQLCLEQLADLEDRGPADVSLAEIESLRLESETWALLQAIMPLRKTAPPEYPDPRSLLASNPYTPPATLAQSIMNASPLLSALVVVREWLHDAASAVPPLDPGATNGYWRFTNHVVKQNLRTGGAAGGIVSEMDPDAVNRGEQAKALAVDDANYERLLLQALFTLVRAGKLDDAIDLCRRAEQPWRAASINGALLLRWKAIASAPRDEEAEDEMDVDEGWRGNLRRKLWKTTCTRAALNQNLSPTERALYAALAPSPQTSAPLKASCRTWSDQLWAVVSIACEERLAVGLAGLASESFWEGGVAGVEAPVPEEDVEEVDGGSRMETEEEDWEKEVLSALESLSSVAVEEGPDANDPFHVSQLHIILDRTDQLLQAFASSLQQGEYDTSTPQYASMTRFFAHLCLYFQMIDIDVPPLATQVILEAYLQVLEAAGQRELIAMYAGALGDNAIERYAMFLTSLELSADTAERRLALTRARDHGLDMQRVAIATAERTIEKAFQELPPAKGPLPSIIGMQPPASELELLLLRSIEWTTFMESTYSIALEQANVILRYFLGCGRVQVAKVLLEMLPADLSSIREPEEFATEHLHYRQFFVVWESLARVVECQALESPSMNRETRAAWLDDYKLLLRQAREQVTKLLTNDWLIIDAERTASESSIDRRRRELVRIRQIYIPELIIRLHALLVASRSKVPENLKHALLLANIVADSRHKLTEDFVSQDGRRLGDYLGAVRQAVLAGLEAGGSDPFRIVTL
ncbi:nuclear pore protein 84/107 [Fomitopsis serialis]|uniref:nuclear pore protein 84/107 n=1 Tax=Fomitopsis serialis TaxID=139415 RepID=UPI0020078F2F|nr:nuclear pore protein 84/107 [Neoantrodia serialis]KAH9929251.1 nuclear pore protein 84/107 [Neoantrodia serialis]